MHSRCCVTVQNRLITQSNSASKACVVLRNRHRSSNRHMLLADSPSVRKRRDEHLDGILNGNSRSPGYVRASRQDSVNDHDHHSHTSAISPLYLGVAVACCGAFSFGFHLSVVNGPLAAIASDLGFAGNAALQGSVVSSLLAGAAVGSLAGSGLADSLGRRKAFLADAVPLALGALLSAMAANLTVMLAGRFLAGLGIGLSSALVPLYISEIAPTSQRGAFGSLNQLMICVGILAALMVNVAMPVTAWRIMFGLAIIPAVMLAGGMLFCVESPAWLMISGQNEEAEDTARELWGADAMTQLGAEKVHTAEGNDVGWSEVFTSRGTSIGMVLFVLQQFSGINAIVYFSSSVFARAGVASGALASAAVGAMNVLGTIFAAGLMDKAGRKQLLSLSFTGMGTCMLLMALGLMVPTLSGFAGPIALLGTLGYIIAFAMGAGPVPGLLVPEITTSKIRGRAVSVAMASHWVCNFVIGQVFLPAVERFGVAGVYMFFAAVCFLTVAFVSKAVVETKGRSVEDIERLMSMA